MLCVFENDHFHPTKDIRIRVSVLQNWVIKLCIESIQSLLLGTSQYKNNSYVYLN